MSDPLKPVRPEQGKPRSYRSPTQNELMDELAGKIADENDARARQRFDEIWNPQKYYSPQKKKLMNWAAIASALFFLGLFLFCALLFSGTIR